MVNFSGQDRGAPVGTDRNQSISYKPQALGEIYYFIKIHYLTFVT